MSDGPADLGPAPWILDWRMVAAESVILATLAGAVGLTAYRFEEAITRAAGISPLLSDLQLGLVALLGVLLLAELLTGSPNFGVRRRSEGIDTRNVLGQVIHFAPTPGGLRGWYAGREVSLWSSGLLERPAYRVAVSRRQRRRLGADERDDRSDPGM